MLAAVTADNCCYPQGDCRCTCCGGIFRGGAANCSSNPHEKYCGVIVAVAAADPCENPHDDRHHDRHGGIVTAAASYPCSSPHDDCNQNCHGGIVTATGGDQVDAQMTVVGISLQLPPNDCIKDHLSHYHCHLKTTPLPTTTTTSSSQGFLPTIFNQDNMLQSTINDKVSVVNKDDISTIVTATVDQKRRKMISTKGITLKPNGTYVSLTYLYELYHLSYF
jgi:hypothetical protein